MPDVERIEDVLGDWYAGQDRGEVVEPEELVRAHPDLAEELRVHFDLLGHLDQALADTRPPLPGLPTEIGEYRIVRELGRGGMGVVYEAEQVPMGRRVALKVLSTTVTSTREAVRRFQREARAAGRLHHTNIVPVHAMGEHAGFWFYAMELVRGRSLANIVEEMRAAPAGSAEPLGTSTRNHAYYRDLAKMFAGVAEALDAAHEEGIIHRDVKPSNLLLAEDGTLKIVDFGLARLEGDGATVTVTGHLLGTPLYMSPEQARSRKVRIDHRTDVYSLGATIYEVLTRRPPFQGDSLAEVCSQIETTEPTLPRRVEPRIPRDLETIVLRAMEKDRDKRYATADDLAQDLRSFADGMPIRARRIGPIGRAWRRVKRNKVRSVLVASVAVLAIVGAVLALWGRGESERRVDLEYVQLCARAEEAVVTVAGTAANPAGVHPGESSAALFTRAIQLAMGRPEAYFGRALAPERTLEGRLADLDAARERGLSERTYHLARAYVFEMERRFAEADLEREQAGGEPARTPAEAFFEARLTLRHVEALGPLNRAIATAPRGSAVRYLALRYRAKIRESRKDFGAALKDLHAAQAMGDESVETAIRAASLWEQMDQKERAESVFAETLAETAGDGSARAWIRLCRACRDTAWRDRATAEAMRALPGNVSILVERADALRKAGKELGQALTLAQEAVRRAPEDGLAHLVQGKVLRRARRIDEALAAFRRAGECDPLDPTPHAELAYTLSRTGQFVEAEREFAKAFQLSPRSIALHYDWAASLRRLHQYEKSLAVWESFRKRWPGWKPAAQNQRQLLILLRRDEEGVRLFEEALREDPGNVDLLAESGLFLAMCGRLERARGCLEEAARLAPDAQGGLYTRMWAYRLMGAYEEALPIAERLYEKEPEYAYWVTTCLRGLGRPEEAREVAAKFVKDHETCDCAISLGYLGAVAGEEERSRKAIEAYPARTSDDAYELARIHALLGDSEAALRWLERADEVGHRLPSGVTPESEFEGLLDDPRFERIDARLRRTK